MSDIDEDDNGNDDNFDNDDDGAAVRYSIDDQCVLFFFLHFLLRDFKHFKFDAR